MHPRLKTLIRTAQVNFPWMLDLKFAAARRYRRWRGIVFDRDFDAIRLLECRGALFLDVGANRGQSTDAILLLAPESRVELFEPNPLLSARLRQLFRDEPRVSVNAFGLASRADSRPLYVPFYKRWMFDGLASFDRESAVEWLRGRMLGYDERHLTVHETTCVLKRLDELELEPFFVKIDVQGYEYDVVKGAEKTLRRFEPILLIEAPPSDPLVSFLASLGYRHFTFRDRSFIPDIVAGNNVYFMTGSKASLLQKHIRQTRI